MNSNHRQKRASKDESDNNLVHQFSEFIRDQNASALIVFHNGIIVLCENAEDALRNASQILHACADRPTINAYENDVVNLHAYKDTLCADKHKLKKSRGVSEPLHFRSAGIYPEEFLTRIVRLAEILALLRERPNRIPIMVIRRRLLGRRYRNGGVRFSIEDLYFAGLMEKQVYLNLRYRRLRQLIVGVEIDSNNISIIRQGRPISVAGFRPASRQNSIQDFNFANNKNQSPEVREVIPTGDRPVPPLPVDKTPDQANRPELNNITNRCTNEPAQQNIENQQIAVQPNSWLQTMLDHIRGGQNFSFSVRISNITSTFVISVPEWLYGRLVQLLEEIEAPQECRDYFDEDDANFNGRYNIRDVGRLLIDQFRFSSFLQNRPRNEIIREITEETRINNPTENYHESSVDAAIDDQQPSLNLQEISSSDTRCNDDEHNVTYTNETTEDSVSLERIETTGSFEITPRESVNDRTQAEVLDNDFKEEHVGNVNNDGTEETTNNRPTLESSGITNEKEDTQQESTNEETIGQFCLDLQSESDNEVKENIPKSSVENFGEIAESIELNGNSNGVIDNSVNGTHMHSIHEIDSGERLNIAEISEADQCIEIKGNVNRPDLDNDIRGIEQFLPATDSIQNSSQQHMTAECVCTAAGSTRECPGKMNSNDCEAGAAQLQNNVSLDLFQFALQSSTTYRPANITGRSVWPGKYRKVYDKIPSSDDSSSLTTEGSSVTPDSNYSSSLSSSSSNCDEDFKQSPERLEELDNSESNSEQRSSQSTLLPSTSSQSNKGRAKKKKSSNKHESGSSSASDSQSCRSRNSSSRKNLSKRKKCEERKESGDRYKDSENAEEFSKVKGEEKRSAKRYKKKIQFFTMAECKELQRKILEYSRNNNNFITEISIDMDEVSIVYLASGPVKYEHELKKELMILLQLEERQIKVRRTEKASCIKRTADDYPGQWGETRSCTTMGAFMSVKYEHKRGTEDIHWKPHLDYILTCGHDKMEGGHFASEYNPEPDAPGNIKFALFLDNDIKFESMDFALISPDGSCEIRPFVRGRYLVDGETRDVKIFISSELRFTIKKAKKKFIKEGQRVQTFKDGPVEGVVKSFSFTLDNTSNKFCRPLYNALQVTTPDRQQAIHGPGESGLLITTATDINKIKKMTLSDGKEEYYTFVKAVGILVANPESEVKGQPATYSLALRADETIDHLLEYMKSKIHEGRRPAELMFFVPEEFRPSTDIVQQAYYNVTSGCSLLPSSVKSSQQQNYYLCETD